MQVWYVGKRIYFGVTFSIHGIPICLGLRSTTIDRYLPGSKIEGVDRFYGYYTDRGIRRYMACLA